MDENTRKEIRRVEADIEQVNNVLSALENAQSYLDHVRTELNEFLNIDDRDCPTEVIGSALMSADLDEIDEFIEANIAANVKVKCKLQDHIIALFHKPLFDKE